MNSGYLGASVSFLLILAARKRFFTTGCSSAVLRARKPVA